MSHFLFINSQNKTDGTNESLDLNIPHGLLSIQADESLTVTLLTASIPNNVLYVSALRKNNRFLWNGSTVTIPDGSYSMPQLTRVLDDLLPTATVSWSLTLNRLTFVSGTTATLTFLPDTRTCFLLGFPLTTGAVAGSTITSQIACQPCSISHFLVHIRGIGHATSQTLTNLTSKQMMRSDLLGALANTAAPFETLVYRASGTEHAVSVTEKHLHALRIFVTDQWGEPLTTLNDWNALIKLEVTKGARVDPLHEELKKLTNLTKVSILTQQASGS